MSTAKVQTSSLAELSSAEAECTRCPLYSKATQVVPGDGPRQARLMVAGEQPGDSETSRENLSSGRPAVFSTARWRRRRFRAQRVFLTNAVKHFKFEPRGKRRLHKRPNASEIERCSWWLGQERMLVRPLAMISMGATASRSLLGRSVSISSLREKVQ